MTDTLSPRLVLVAPAGARLNPIPSSARPALDPPADRREGALLHDVFTASARRTPTAPAVLSGGVVTSYADLDRRSDRLARRLAARGVGPGVAVGISMERSADAYAALLAVLKAGAAYVGLDPTTPPERVAAIAEDCAMGLVLYDGRGSLPACIRPVRLADLEAEATGATGATGATSVGTPEGRTPPAATPDDLCYIIYTSGSTGRPKGVAIPHRAAAHYVRAAAGVYGVAAHDRVWQGFSLAFDASVEEIWLAFAAGACLVKSAVIVRRGRGVQ